MYCLILLITESVIANQQERKIVRTSKLNKPHSKIFYFLINLAGSLSLLTITNISLATSAKDQTTQKPLDNSAWYLNSQIWLIKKYNDLSSWADEKYQKHPEWKVWSDKISNTANQASETVQNFFANNSHSNDDDIGTNDKKHRNHLSVPTNSSQAGVLNSIESDDQLDPLESPIPSAEQTPATDFHNNYSEGNQED